MQIEVVLASAGQQLRLTLDLPAGSTVAAALAQRELAGVVYSAVGLFGQVVTPDTVLHDGDRVELYRPLLAEPKEARRRRSKAV
jgi:putative ubiquitin-RnfH superfamily antitoxin RatB of RatAB toxin-antitoxin module